jgi:hypothetical protein
VSGMTNALERVHSVCPEQKPPVDPSMTITRHTPSIDLRHTGWLREAAASSRLIAKSARQFEGHGADGLSGTSAKSWCLTKNRVTFTQKTVPLKEGTGGECISVVARLSEH